MDRTCIERPPIEPRLLWAPVRRRGGEGARGEKAEAVQISMAAGRSARRMLQAATICEFVLNQREYSFFTRPSQQCPGRSLCSWRSSATFSARLASSNQRPTCNAAPQTQHTLSPRLGHKMSATLDLPPRIFPSRRTSRDHHVHLEPSSCRRETTLNWPRSGENAHAQRLFHAWRPSVGARGEWPTPLGNLSKCMAWVRNHALERSLCFFSLGMRHER